MGEERLAIENFFTALNKLKELKIINNKKDFTCQLGEYIISKMYDATIAISAKQKDWDMKFTNCDRIQVKSHSKAETTKRRNTDFKYHEDSEIDILIIFKIPFPEALKLKTKSKYPVIRWSEIPEEYEVKFIKEFRNNEFLKYFY
jgi:hypothetical protein